MRTIGREPEDARIEVHKGKPRVVPGQGRRRDRPRGAGGAVRRGRRTDWERSGGSTLQRPGDPALLHHRRRRGAQGDPAGEHLHDVLPLRRVPQRQPAPRRRADRRHPAAARPDLQPQRHGGGADRGQRLHRGLHRLRRHLQEGPRRRRLADRDDHVQRDVLRRAQGRRAQAALGLHRPLPRRARGDRGVAVGRPAVHQHHALRRADQGPRPQVDAEQGRCGDGVDVLHQALAITSSNGPRTNSRSAAGALPPGRRLRGGQRDLGVQRQRLPDLPRPRIRQGAAQGEVPHRLHRRATPSAAERRRNRSPSRSRSRSRRNRND